MKILIVNVHSDANAGDAILNHAGVDLLIEQFPTAEITLAMNDPESHQPHPHVAHVVPSFTYWFKGSNQPSRGWHLWQSIQLLGDSLYFAYQTGKHRTPPSPPRPWAPLLTAYHQADMVISCPGNFLYSSGFIGIPFLLALYAMLYGSLCSKPLYMMPQTIGPFTRRREETLTRWVLSRARLIFVRDDLSLDLIQDRLKLSHNRVYLVPDVAFRFQHTADAETQSRTLLQQYQVPLDNNTPLLGITLINWGAQNRHFKQQAVYETAVAQAIQRFIQETGGHVVLFSQVHGPQPADDDRVPAGRVFAQIEETTQVTYIQQQVAPAVLKAAYAQMDMLMGSRLHSNIFALSNGTPVIALQYQYKTRGIMRMVNLEQWVLPLEQITASRLSSFLQSGWEKRLVIKQTITDQLPKLQQELATIGQRIADDFTHLTKEQS